MMTVWGCVRKAIGVNNNSHICGVSTLCLLMLYICDSFSWLHIRKTYESLFLIYFNMNAGPFFLKTFI